jgi:hypothetical protein
VNIGPNSSSWFAEQLVRSFADDLAGSDGNTANNQRQLLGRLAISC